MIRSRYPIQPTADVIELTDEHGGSGQLRIMGVGRGRWVQDTTSRWAHGRYEYDEYQVFGKGTPDEYEMTFSLKLYPEGFIRPASLAGATKLKLKAEAISLAEKWLAEGGPGLQLEHPEETQRRRREARSAYQLSKITRSLSSLTDEDLTKLSEVALRTITKRAENAAKEAAKAEAKRLKAAEKARVAAEKAAKKKAREEAAAAKAAKAAEKARKQAEREATRAVAAAP